MMDIRASKTSRWCSVLTLAVLLVILAGCALTAKQKAAVSLFSGSAATLGDVTSSELKAMRDGTVKMTIERLLLGGKSKDCNLGDQTSLDRGFDLKRVMTVAGATQALAAYGKSLAALVDDTQSAELKVASNEFVASLGRVPTAKERLSDKQLEVIGTVVQEVGGLWIEWKRKQAVTTIVKESRQAVDHLCDLLIRDFDPEKGWVAKQLQVVEEPLMAEATNGLYDGRTYNDRKVALEAFRLAHGSRMRRTEVLKRVTDGATAMKKANSALAQAVENSDWSIQDIQDFAQRARSLQTAVKIIVTE
ncbi:MAG: hypothetical protein U1C55_10545 [Smithellaceae bacterium]|nr:hypothetical protein [Smithellaceae bacterium]